MPLNKDGLEAGQPVDFDTLMRIKAEQRTKVQSDDDTKPAKRGKGKEAVRSGDERQHQDLSEPDEAQEA